MRRLMHTILMGVICTTPCTVVLMVEGWTSQQQSKQIRRTGRSSSMSTTLFVTNDIQFELSSEISPIIKPSNPVQEEEENNNNNNIEIPSFPLLSLTFDELSQYLGGSGKAKACWNCFNIGIDPSWYYSSRSNADESTTKEEEDDKEDAGPFLKGWTHQQVKDQLIGTNKRGSPTVLGHDTLKKIGIMDSIEEGMKLSKLSISPDGTTKLLLEIVSDGLEVETVIIPWEERKRSTLCVSSQVGCRQGCTFCATGRMGIVRSLTTSEILAQMYWANKICRLLPQQQGYSTSSSDNGTGKMLYPIDNCVFMGMGEPADNADSVVEAAKIMVDVNMFSLAPRRVTISTIAPNPEVFSTLSKAPVVLAWSVHSSRDKIRRQLVPTTKHTMVELRNGLMEALKGRSKRLRNTMLEIALLDGINDSPEDAEHLAEFCRPFFEGPDAVKGIKLTVNLIPWNDISASSGPASTYRQPKMERVVEYQKILVENGILCFVRTTRGDEENAACGMLSTAKRKIKAVN